jgi:Sec-independent protein translocase protein TatA
VFGISMWEIAIIAVVALIILGPRQLVEAARVAGKLYREIQKLTWEIKEQVNIESISSLTETDHNSKQSSTDELYDDSVTDEDLVPETGEKTGPDFYADLMEQAAAEEAEKEKDAGELEEGSEEKSSKEKKPTEGSAP